MDGNICDSLCFVITVKEGKGSKYFILCLLPTHVFYLLYALSVIFYRWYDKGTVWEVMAQILVVDDQEDIVQLVVKALRLQNAWDCRTYSVLDLDRTRCRIYWISRYTVLTVSSFVIVRDQGSLPISSITAKKRKGLILSKAWLMVLMIVASHLGLKNFKRVAARPGREHRKGATITFTWGFSVWFVGSELYI